MQETRVKAHIRQRKGRLERVSEHRRRAKSTVSSAVEWKELITESKDTFWLPIYSKMPRKFVFSNDILEKVEEISLKSKERNVEVGVVVKSVKNNKIKFDDVQFGNEMNISAVLEGVGFIHTHIGKLEDLSVGLDKLISINCLSFDDIDAMVDSKLVFMGAKNVESNDMWIAVASAEGFENMKNFKPAGKKRFKVWNRYVDTELEKLRIEGKSEEELKNAFKSMLKQFRSEIKKYCDELKIRLYYVKNIKDGKAVEYNGTW